MNTSGLWKFLSLAALALLGLLAAAVLWHSPEMARPTLARVDEITVVIDPGHGGEDGGTVAANGAVESQINLEIARRLDLILRFCGCDTELLRGEDISLYDSGCSTLRQKKISDIRNRVQMINAQANPRLISIHQNHFSQSQYHGAQVFYANGPLGQPWAALTQQNLKGCLDPGNQRKVKPVPHDVYLMNHITCPAILVECGFLSNTEECAKLQDPGYQTALATVIAGSYLQSVQKEGETANVSQSETSVLLHGMRQ